MNRKLVWKIVIAAVFLSTLCISCSSEGSETGTADIGDPNPVEVQSERPEDGEIVVETGSADMPERSEPVADVTPEPEDGADTEPDAGDSLEAEDMVPVPPAGMESTTDRGFQKWEWWDRSVLDAYQPYRQYFAFRIEGSRVRLLEYWISHGAEEPDVDSPQQRDTERYNRDGELVERTSYSNELGYDYTRYRYDDLGRLVNVEERVSVRDVGFDRANVQVDQSFWIQYFEGSELDADVSRLVKSYDGERRWIEGERRIEGGWEYIGRGSSSSVLRLRDAADQGFATAIETEDRFGTARLSYTYDEFANVVQTVETYLDGESAKFVVTYERDDDGRLLVARTWDHRNESQGRVREFSDHDDHGNWRRRVTTLDGEIESIVVRRMEYW